MQELSSNRKIVKILVFDDDELQASHMTNVINEAGYKAWGTSIVSEAIRLSMEIKPDIGVFDCRIDLATHADGLPVDGITAFSLIKRQFPFIEPIFVTAFRDSYESRAMELEALIIDKPYEDNKLIEKIDDKIESVMSKKLDAIVRLEQAAISRGLDPSILFNVISDLEFMGTDYGIIIDKIYELKNIIDSIEHATTNNIDILTPIVEIFGKELPEMNELLKSVSDDTIKTAESYEKRAQTMDLLIKDMFNE